MTNAPYFASTRPHLDAVDLLAQFGGAAKDAARARASESRRKGNYLHVCRWREVERLIEALAAGPGGGTVH